MMSDRLICDVLKVTSIAPFTLTIIHVHEVPGA